MLRRFDPHCPPDEFPEPEEGKQYTTQGVRAFFGTALGDDDAVLELVMDWKRYRENYPTLPSALKAQPMGKFWADPHVAKHCKFRPNLAKLGRWYSNTPPSNVAAERAFAYLRLLEVGVRLSMSSETLRAEVINRANIDILRHLLEKKLKELK